MKNKRKYSVRTASFQVQIEFGACWIQSMNVNKKSVIFINRKQFIYKVQRLHQTMKFKTMFKNDNIQHLPLWHNSHVTRAICQIPTGSEHVKCVSLQFSIVFGFTGDIMNIHRTNNYTHWSILTTKILITPKVWWLMWHLLQTYSNHWWWPPDICFRESFILPQPYDIEIRIT